MIPPQQRTAGWRGGAFRNRSDNAITRATEIPASIVITLLLACLAAGVSIGLQGFTFAVVNNSYHIPIVDGWVEDPQFATDQYIQSLRYHTSYVWPLARWLSHGLGTYPTFLLLHVLNRLAMFAGIGLLLRELGVRTAACVAAGMMTIAVTRYLLAASGPGEHDLFMPFLNHSSLTWPFIFASWLCLLRGHMVMALALQGPVFAVNAFVAICGGPAVAAGALAFLPADKAGRRALALRCLAGALLAIVIAAPTIAWIIRSFTDQPAGAPFSFIGFLHQYYLKHWYITAASPRRLVSFAIVTASGLACIRFLGDRARGFLQLWWGTLIVFVAGAALPYLVDSRTLLDLHPMRVGAGCLVMLCVIVTVAYLSRMLEAASDVRSTAAAVLGLVGLAIGQMGLVLMALAVGIGVFTVTPGRAGVAAMRYRTGLLQSRSVALVMVSLLAVSGWRLLWEQPPFDLALLSEARDAGLWIRTNTFPGEMIFVPQGAVDGEDDPVSVWARRPVWYDWKEGAAVMWTPSYYLEWSGRRSETATLHTIDDTISYACTHHIGIVVETADSVADDADRARLIAAISYRNAAYVVLRTSILCPTAR